MNIVEKPLYHIYGIVNLVNNKRYIGQTKNGYRKRFIQHLCPKSHSRLLRNSIHKYGKENFECELIDVAYSREEANAKEKMWIKLLKTTDRKYGYNISSGGAGDITEATKKKMSQSKIGTNNSFYGKHHTLEARQKMSKSKSEMYQKEHHPRARKVMCVETGKVYGCIVSASEDTGANKCHIREVANNVYGRKTAGGYHWKWA